MQSANVLDVCFDSIQNFLTVNGAGIFAKLLYNIPLLYQAALSPKLSMIIAPRDERLQWLATETNKPLAELFQTQAGRDVLANHISTIPTQKVYPMFTSINRVTYGSGPADLVAIDIIASKIICGVPVLIISQLIGYQQQLTKSQRPYEPGVFANLTHDAFRALINNGKLRGRDLISLCRTNDYVNDNFCNYRDVSGKTIFHHLVKDEFSIDVSTNEDARAAYVHYHQDLEAKSYPTIGILIDHGQDWADRYRKTRHTMGISLRLGEEDIEATSMSLDNLYYALWSHPINLYLLASVYKPLVTGEPYRISLVRLTRNPTGKYVSPENGERFSLYGDSAKGFLVVNNFEIRPDEVPIAQRVMHYTRPYLETIPFLYNKVIANYNRELLLRILPDLYRAATRDVDSADFFASADLKFTKITDFIKGPVYSRKLLWAIEQVLQHLALNIINDEFPEEKQEMKIQTRRDTPALVTSIDARFYDAYTMVPKGLLAIILQLILLFSGAVIVR